MLRQYSALEATLFELPAAAAVARQKLTGDPIAGRLHIVAGDFFADPISDGHDAVLVANVIHLYTPERNLALLQRIPDGARLLLVDFWTDPTHTQPLFAALMAGAFLLYGGDVYSADEVHQWLTASGWRPVEHLPLVGPVSLLVAETA